MLIRVDINYNQNIETPDDRSAFISCPYNEEVLYSIRQISPRHWDNDEKIWEIPYVNLGDFASSIRMHCIITTDRIKESGKKEFFRSVSKEFLPSEEEKPLIRKSKITPETFGFKTAPFNHQKECFEYGMSHNKFFLGDEAGMGKTKQVIDIAVAKKEEFGYKHALIVCGVNGLKWNWVNEIAVHSNEGAYIIGQRETRNGLRISDTKGKIADIKDLDKIPEYFLVTNVETLRNKEIAKMLSEKCISGEIGLVAIDEVHKCKNPQSQQGKGILALNSRCRIAMTGTPIMNSPLDLFIILKWLGYESKNFYTFKKTYCIMGGYEDKEVIGYKNTDVLKQKLADISIRRLKADVLDLPEKTFIKDYIELYSPQKRIYTEMHTKLLNELDKLDELPDDPLSMIMRLRQITGRPDILSSTVTESAKLDRMEDLVEEVVSSGEKVVIFSNWTSITDEAIRRLEKYKPAVITGETSEEDRMKEVNRFQNDSDCTVIIGTIGAMGTGLTLTAGTVEIFIDEPWNKALLDQAVDRCHRVGSKNNLTVYLLMCKDTVDERIHELIEIKGGIADFIVDNKQSRSDILRFLLS